MVLGVVSALLFIGCGGGGDQGGGGGGGGQTVKIVSDLPLQGANRFQSTTMVNAIEMAIDERGGKAGDVNIEYESQDNATAQATYRSLGMTLGHYRVMEQALCGSWWE